MFTRLGSRPLLLLAWTSLALTLQVSGGFYRPAGLVLLLVAAVFLVWAALRARGEAGVAADVGDPLPALVLALMLGVSLLHPPGDAIAAPWFLPVWRAGLALVGVLLALTVLLRRLNRPIFVALVVAGVVVGVASRAALIVAAPAPVIDVFPMFQESAAHLLDGLNPYTHAVTDAYGGARNYGYQVLYYAYPPLNLYFQTVAFALTYDVRFASLASEILAIVALWRLGRGGATAGWAVLLLLFFPRGLFVIEQAWTEPLIVGAYGLVALLAARHPRSLRLAVAYGVLIGLKQYLVFFVLHGLMLERRIGRIALAALVVVLPALPFVLADAGAFVDYGLLFQLATGFRPDGLTLPAALFALTGVTVGKGVAAGAGLVVALAAWRLLASLGVLGWLYATTLTTFTLFLFGSQAFANYYYLIAAMMLFAFAYRPAPVDQPG